jgi:hydroxypyruvate isomerase
MSARERAPRQSNQSSTHAIGDRGKVSIGSRRADPRDEVKRIERYTADLDDEAVDVMGNLTALAFGSYDPPGGRAANIRFVAANVS